MTTSTLECSSYQIFTSHGATLVPEKEKLRLFSLHKTEISLESWSQEKIEFQD